MAALVVLPGDEFFSEGYMDAFYKAHVASSRTRGSNNLDEDIAAIEAEIRKVQHYRSNFQQYRFDHQQLNSCGNSECSDEEEQDDDFSPTSIFKVYNSSSSKVDGSNSPYHPHHQKSPDIFTWASAQQVQHDHNYCLEASGEDMQHTVIDHGTVNMCNIQWHQLSPTKRAYVVQKLSYILQQKPSGRQSPTFSSLDLLPTSLANWVRKTGTLGFNSHKQSLAPLFSKTHSCLKSANSTKMNLQRVEQKLRSAAIQQAPSLTLGPSTRHASRKKASPYYSKLTRQLNIEVTRVRSISSCSEGEDPVIID